jgi:hypothetical protein
MHRRRWMRAHGLSKLRGWPLWLGVAIVLALHVACGLFLVR